MSIGSELWLELIARGGVKVGLAEKLDVVVLNGHCFYLRLGAASADVVFFNLHF